MTDRLCGGRLRRKNHQWWPPSPISRRTDGWIFIHCDHEPMRREGLEGTVTSGQLPGVKPLFKVDGTVLPKTAPHFRHQSQLWGFPSYSHFWPTGHTFTQITQNSGKLYPYHYNFVIELGYASEPAQGRGTSGWPGRTPNSKSPLSHLPESGHDCQVAAAAAKSLRSCPTLCDPIDGSLPGSSVHGIFQARGLGWGAIAFSGLSC